MEQWNTNVAVKKTSHGVRDVSRHSMEKVWISYPRKPGRSIHHGEVRNLTDVLMYLLRFFSYLEYFSL